MPLLLPLSRTRTHTPPYTLTEAPVPDKLGEVVLMVMGWTAGIVLDTLSQQGRMGRRLR